VASTSFQLITRDGLRLGARWRPAARDSRDCAVVLVHGFTASMDNPEVEAFAIDLADSGYAVLSYDSRGHKTSEGFCTLGDREQLDVESAVAEARSRSGRVVVLGASMGAISILRYAATDPGLDGAIALSSPARWKLPKSAPALLATWMTRTKLGRRFAARFLGVRIDPVWANPAPPVDLVRDITYPLAIVHGHADRFINKKEARRLAMSSGGPARLELVPRMGHAFDELGLPSIRRALDWVLAPGPA